MDVIMTYFFLYLISIFSIFAIIETLRFQPTRYWLASKFGVYRIMGHIEDVSKLDIREIETMLQYLIIMRCSDENRVVNETRNGLRLRFYPEGVERNKRWMPGNYVAIYHDSCQSCLRITFDGSGVLRSQIERPHDDSILQFIYLKSKQGDLDDFYKESFSERNKVKILENYRDYLMRRIL